MVAAGGELAHKQQTLCSIVKGFQHRTCAGDAYAIACDSSTGRCYGTNKRTKNTLILFAYEVSMTISNEKVVGVDGTLWVSEIKFVPIKTIINLLQFQS